MIRRGECTACGEEVVTVGTVILSPEPVMFWRIEDGEARKSVGYRPHHETCDAAPDSRPQQIDLPEVELEGDHRHIDRATGQSVDLEEDDEPLTIWDPEGIEE